MSLKIFVEISKVNFYLSLLCLICGVRSSCVSCFGRCLGSLGGNECVYVMLSGFCHSDSLLCAVMIFFV